MTKPLSDEAVEGMIALANLELSAAEIIVAVRAAVDGATPQQNAAAALSVIETYTEFATKVHPAITGAVGSFQIDANIRAAKAEFDESGAITVGTLTSIANGIAGLTAAIGLLGATALGASTVPIAAGLVVTSGALTAFALFYGDEEIPLELNGVLENLLTSTRDFAGDLVDEVHVAALTTLINSYVEDREEDLTTIFETIDEFAGPIFDGFENFLFGNANDRPTVTVTPITSLNEGESGAFRISLDEPAGPYGIALVLTASDSLLLELSGPGVDVLPGGTILLTIPEGQSFADITVDALLDGNNFDETAFVQVDFAPFNQFEDDSQLNEVAFAFFSVEDQFDAQGIHVVPGTNSDDNLIGSNLADEIDGLGGDDFIDGNEGDDVLIGGDGNDKVIGGEGDDRVSGDAGKDALLGEAGEDNLEGGDAADFVFGGENDDIITGDAGGDFLAGGSGVDLIVGGAGDDVILGDAELTGGASSINTNATFTINVTSPLNVSVDISGFTVDVIDAPDQGDGVDEGDRISGGLGNDVIGAGAGDDIVFGDEGDDFIAGGSHNDFIRGGSGNDIIQGDSTFEADTASPGSDTIYGDDGHDLIFGELGDDQLFGGEGDDEIHGDVLGDTANGGNDFINAGAGDDLVLAGPGDDFIVGGSGEDDLQGGSGDDIVDGGDDDDLIGGFGGNDALFGGQGNDVLVGGGDNDSLVGGEGQDTLFGDEGEDNLAGGRGEDTLFGGEGHDILIGDEGNDELQGGIGNDVLKGGLGNDLLAGQEGDDTLEGGSGNDELQGGLGEDLLLGGDGADTIFGEDGNDTIDGGFGDDVLTAGSGDDSVVGGFGNDTIYAVEGVNIIDAGVGDDIIFAGTGIDTVYGGLGNDTLVSGAGSASFDGGAGNDTFVVSENSGSVEISTSIDSNILRIAGGFSLADLTLNRQNGNLLVAVGSTTIAYNGWANGASSSLELEEDVAIDNAVLEAEINDAPELAVSIEDQSANIGAEFSFQVVTGTFVDSDDAVLQLSAALQNDEPLPAWLSFDPLTAIFSGTPDAADVGSLEIELSATDANGLSVTESFSLVIDALNTPPEVAIPLPDRLAGIDLPFNFEIQEGVFTDADLDDVLEYEATLVNGDPLPSWIEFDAETRKFSGVPAESDAGGITILVTATDQSGESVSDEFELEVKSTVNESVVNVVENSGVNGTSLGSRVAGVGDINGDGFDDFSLAVLKRQPDFRPSEEEIDPQEPPGLRQNVPFFYGREEGYPTLFDVFDEEDIVFTEEVTMHSSDDTHRVVPLGDFNGDGFADFAFDAAISHDSGWVTVVFGGSSFPSTNIDELTSSAGFHVGQKYVLDDTDGPVLDIKSVGDVDSDGFDDFIYGERINRIDGNSSSSISYEPISLVLGNVSGTNLPGFELDGIRTLDASGDFNGDGKNDPVLIDGDFHAYVLFDGIPNYFAVPSYNSLGSVESKSFSDNKDIFTADYIGDFNGDGLDDLVVTEASIRAQYDSVFAEEDFAYVVFGQSGIDSLQDIDLSALDGSNGFILDSRFRQISAGGDVDGDGLADLLVITPHQEARVIFGNTDGFGGSFQLEDIDVNSGLNILTSADISSGSIYSDINGDGFNDIILGAPGAGMEIEDPDTGDTNDAGESYIIYGRDFRQLADFLGSGAPDHVLVSEDGFRAFTFGGDDRIDIVGGTDIVINTGAGDDTIDISGGKKIDIKSPSGNNSYDFDLGNGGPSQEGSFSYGITTGSGANSFHFSGSGSGSLTFKGASGGGNSMSFGDRGFGSMSLGIGSLKITVVGGGYEIHLEDFDPNDVLGGPRNIDVFSFTDGDITYEELVALGFDIVGTADNDNLSGTNVVDRIEGLDGDDQIAAGDGDDTLSGGLGDDTLDGGAGSDTFLFSVGDGQDILVDADGLDTLSFGAGILPSDLTVEQIDSDLRIKIGDVDQLTVRQWFLDQANQIESFLFADDNLVMLSNVDIEALATGTPELNVITGTSSSNTLVGTEAGDEINGLAGNDNISGLGGDDVIIGGAGNDTLNGGAGDDVFLITGTSTNHDTITGGDGVDTILGGDEDDTFRFHNFSGTKTVEVIDGGLGTNVIAGTSSSNTIDLSGTSLIGIGQIDGGAGNDNITGSAGDDVIIGGTGNDTLNGGAGDDVFLITGTSTNHDTITGGDGFDTILGGDEDDTFRFHNFSGTKTVEVIDGGLGSNVIAGTSSSNTINLSGADLLGISEIDGGAGNDNITGSAGDDVIIGGTGNDTLNGDAGDDVFLITGSSTNHDTITGGDGVDTILGGDEDDTFRFHNFSGTKTVEVIDGGLGANVIAGTSSSNTIDLSGTSLIGIGQIDGGAGNDNITGSAGDDVIIGGAGNDTLNGGEGDDVFQITGTSTNHDTITGGDGVDTILGGDEDDTFRFHNFSGTKTVEVIDGGLGSNKIAGTSSSNTIDLSDTALLGISEIDGGAGNDNITGSVAADLIIGGAGNDTLNGGAGDDVFRITGTSTNHDTITGGDGNDTILGGDEDDTFRFHNFSGTKTVEVIDGGLGTNVIAGTSSSNTINLSGTSLLGISQIDGGAGNDNITGSSAADVILGGPGNDTLNGGAGDDVFRITGTSTNHDTITGGDGNDTILGGDEDDTFRFHNFSGTKSVEVIDGGLGNNKIAGTSSSNTIDLSGAALLGIGEIDGGAGNDNITGSAGDDVIVGGAGNDTLKGGEGDDRYFFSASSGNDVIRESNLLGDNDVLQFGSLIDYEDLWFSKSGNNLVISQVGSGDKITIQDWYSSDGYRIESIESIDGTLSANDIDQLVDAMAEFEAPVGITGAYTQDMTDTLSPLLESVWQLY